MWVLHFGFFYGELKGDAGVGAADTFNSCLTPHKQITHLPEPRFPHLDGGTKPGYHKDQGRCIEIMLAEEGALCLRSAKHSMGCCFY